jgi:hypothetical protein
MLREGTLTRVIVITQKALIINTLWCAIAKLAEPIAHQIIVEKHKSSYSTCMFGNLNSDRIP